MNVLKSSPMLLKRITGCGINQTIRHVSTADNTLINIDVNPKTGIALLTMKKPPVNSLCLELVNEFISSFIRLEKEKVKGLVITSAMPGVFTAGLDILEMYKPKQDRLKTYWTGLQDMWLNLYSSPYPTAAAITGHSPGGGCQIATSCDYRVMMQGNFTIGLNESQLGLAVPTWFIDTFKNVVPRRIAEMALISGKLFTLEEALKIGLIDEVASSKEDAVAKALNYVTKLSKFNLSAMAQTKMSFRYSAITHLRENREQDLKVFLKFVNAPEIQKGLEEYLKKLKKGKK